MNAPPDRLERLTLEGSAFECGKAYGRMLEPNVMAFCRMEFQPDAAKLRYARRCWDHVVSSASHSGRRSVV